MNLSEFEGQELVRAGDVPAGRRRLAVPESRLGSIRPTREHDLDTSFQSLLVIPCGPASSTDRI